MTFVIPEQQRVLTPAEYQGLGYQLRGDFSQLEISRSPDKPLTEGYSFPVYRAETKEEFAIDIAVGIAKVGFATATGGTSAVVRTTLGYVTSLLT